MEIVTVKLSKEDLNFYLNLNVENVKTINIEDVKINKGDILFIELNSIKTLYDTIKFYEELKYQDNHKHLYNKYDLYEYDRLNRKIFKNYKKVYIFSIDDLLNEYNYKSLYSNIHFIKFNDIPNFKQNANEKRISNIKNKNINLLKDYVDKQKDYFNSKDIIKKFNVSNRWIKRYMYDMNKLYNNIGYSYTKRMWYKTSEE